MAKKKSAGTAGSKSGGKKSARRRPRTRYTDQQRTEILAAAQRDGLTANDVQKKFGVTPVTYYSWRKKGGAGRRRKGRAAKTGAVVGRAVAGAMNVADAIRTELRLQIRRLLPEVIASELGGAPRGRRGRRAR